MSDIQPHPPVASRYLGDAVQASFDGWQIELRTIDGRDQLIYLEPSVLRALAQYGQDVGVLPRESGSADA